MQSGFVLRRLISLWLILPLCSAEAAVLTKDTIWQQEQLVSEDTLIPPGITLTVRPGTQVKISPAESTKTDPEFISPLTEIIVRGKINIEGTPTAPVRFTSTETGKGGEWAGILIDGGDANVSNCDISGADSALYLLDARVEATNITLSGNRYGATIIGNSKTAIKNSKISGNDYGLATLTASTPLLTDTVIKDNRKKDVFQEEPPKVLLSAKAEQTPTQIPLARSYRDEALVGDTVWRGRIRVDGNLRVPEGSRLLITPGTVVEFSRKDTNGDGLGENGILIQGALIAKGTKEAPILFHSAENNRRMGDWDAINLMNSDKTENLIENCIFEDAYRGLHFHFSTVKVIGSRFSNNLRGIQFQESAVEILNSDFTFNKSAVQGRDSQIRFDGNRINSNHQGGNFFRNHLTFTSNQIAGTLKEGVRIREGSAAIERNILTGNRQGLLLSDIYYASVACNLIANSSETGLAMKNVDNVGLQGNYFGNNGANGLSLQEAKAEISGNLFLHNAERGIGITSFGGSIAGNSFAGNRLYAIDLESPEDLDASNNWWGGDIPAAVVFDKKSDSTRGRVLTEPALPKAPQFTWPVAEFAGQLTLAGDIIIKGQPLIRQGNTLAVDPGTTVRFTDGSGLLVNGRLNSNGTPAKPVIFTAYGDKKAGAWDEIVFEQALDSTISNTVIEYATWGIHGHFTNLVIDHLLARNNSGGMRFRSGPVLIKNSVFRNNGIGIRSYIGNGVIESNIITNNEIGLFVRERGGGLTVRRNNFFANSEYSIRSGDFNTEDIPASGNWWGEQPPQETIFDGRQEEGIGKVLFEPFLSAPVNLDSAGVK
ncbi:MAG: right-handed parallel beta-helix repeat-containing protein [Geobacter sp.]|nr:right-handed parallel beta-helix repeat-containing protein [Geobacter sp.]